MKKIVLSLFVLLFSFGFAQEVSNDIDIVYLKDGSIIKGVIIEQIIGESITIKRANQEVYTYASSLIEKISKEENFESNVKWMDNFKSKDKGWFIEGEGLVGFVSKSRYVFNVTTGYKFNRFAYLGIGLGFGSQKEPNSGSFQGYSYIQNEPVLEALITYSGDILNKRVTPFYQISAGYMYLPTNSGLVSNILENGDWDDPNYSYTGTLMESYGGPFGEVGIGVRIKSLKRVYYKFGIDMRIGSELYTYKDIYFENGQEELLITNDWGKMWNGTGSFQLRFGIGF